MNYQQELSRDCLTYHIKVAWIVRTISFHMVRSSMILFNSSGSSPVSLVSRSRYILWGCLTLLYPCDGFHKRVSCLLLQQSPITLSLLVHFLSKVARKRRAVLLKMKSFIGLLWYNIARSFDKLIRFIKYFLSTSFQKQVLGLLLIFPWESFLRGTEIWNPVYLLWIHSLTWFGQFKQKSIQFDWKYTIFFSYDVISNFDDI